MRTSADGRRPGSTSSSTSVAGISQRRCRKWSDFSSPVSASASRSATPSRNVRMRSLSKPRSPRHSASSTVVTPAAAHCASCASSAERDGQRAFDARLHLAFQIVGMHVDDAGDQEVAVHVQRAGQGGPPGRDLPDHRRLPSPACRRPTRSAAPGSRWSGWSGASCSVLQRRHGKQTIGHGVAHLVVVEDADNGNPPRLGIGDHADHHVPVGRVQRGGRLVQQQDRMSADEPPRQIDPLLLAARERRRRQAVQPGAGCSAGTAAPAPARAPGSAGCRARPAPPPPRPAPRRAAPRAGTG